MIFYLHLYIYFICIGESTEDLDTGTIEQWFSCEKFNSKSLQEKLTFPGVKENCSKIFKSEKSVSSEYDLPCIQSGLG